MGRLPRQYRKFIRDYPEIASAYERLGEKVHSAGPLDVKTRALVKLGISIGAGLEGGVHSHVRKALALEVTPDELRHVVFLSLPTLGFPSMMAALSWVNDILKERRRK